MLEEISLKAEQPVLVLGASGYDVVGRIQGEPEPGTSNPALIRTSFGGTARNVAENLARLGQEVWLLSVVGDDQVGNQMMEKTSGAGVNVDFVIRTSEHPTGSYLAVVNPNGELRFALDDMRAITALTPDYLREHQELFERASLLFTDANLPEDTLETAIQLAAEARLPVCADPTSTSLADKLRPYLEQIVLLTPNSAEAEVFCQRPLSEEPAEKGLEAAKQLVLQGVELAIVTLGEAGVSYATSETSGHIPAIRTETIDPTGAGDALCAAVMFALLNDIPTDEAVRLGVSAAALTLRHRGAVVLDLSLERLYDQLV